MHSSFPHKLVKKKKRLPKQPPGLDLNILTQSAAGPYQRQ